MVLGSGVSEHPKNMRRRSSSLEKTRFHFNQHLASPCLFSPLFLRPDKMILISPTITNQSIHLHIIYYSISGVENTFLSMEVFFSMEESMQSDLPCFCQHPRQDSLTRKVFNDATLVHALNMSLVFFSISVEFVTYGVQ